jgi:hypothetical protein
VERSVVRVSYRHPGGYHATRLVGLLLEDEAHRAMGETLCDECSAQVDPEWDHVGGRLGADAGRPGGVVVADDEATGVIRNDPELKAETCRLGEYQHSRIVRMRRGVEP